MPEEVRMEFWSGGMNSLLYPTLIPQNQYHWGENLSIRGGIVGNRNGTILRQTIPSGNLQGFTMFTPTGDKPHFVFAVEGLIYVSRYPFDTYYQLPDIQFVASAKRIHWCRAVKSAEYNEAGDLVRIEPYEVLMMQDGYTRAAYWDGSVGVHLDPSEPFDQTPYGTWMAWSGSRLWVARGVQLFASDLADPLSFTENDYTAEADSFRLPSDITGIIETPDKNALLVFTEETTTAFQSNILDRPEWQNTPDFQKVILPGIGCIAGKSTFSQYGLTFWYAKGGLVSLNSALQTYRSSQITFKDQEMMRSKSNMSPDKSIIAATNFENFIMVSVPSGDKYNAHTWVLDNAIADQLNADTPAAWTGVWTGHRPVEWATSTIDGVSRCFFASRDYSEYESSNNHIWEAFRYERTDNGTRMYCRFETKITELDGKPKRFKYAELDLINILDDVDITVNYCGLKGGYTEVLSTVLQAEVGSIGSVDQDVIDVDASILEAYKPQTRTIRTIEVDGSEGSCSVCDIESTDTNNVDKGFGLLIEWTGQMAIRAIRLFYDTETDQEIGACEPSEEGEHNIVTTSGCGIEYVPETVITEYLLDFSDSDNSMYISLI